MGGNNFSTKFVEGVGTLFNDVTGKLKTMVYQANLADDITFSLPVITSSAFGIIAIGSDQEHTLFTVTGGGTVTLISNSTNVAANQDTDAKLCIGTAASQEPLLVKNRLGSTLNVNLFLFYD